MAERPAFTEIQLRFTAHIRDPERIPPPADVDDRRMAVYRDLLYSLRFPTFTTWAAITVSTAVVFVAGVIVFRRLEPNLAEEL